MKRTTSITCDITVHENYESGLSKVVNLSSHANVSLPVVCVVSLNVSMHTKRFNDLPESTHVHRFTEIQNPSRKVCSEYILFPMITRSYSLKRA